MGSSKNFRSAVRQSNQTFDDGLCSSLKTFVVHLTHSAQLAQEYAYLSYGIGNIHLDLLQNSVLQYALNGFIPQDRAGHVIETRFCVVNPKSKSVPPARWAVDDASKHLDHKNTFLTIHTRLIHLKRQLVDSSAQLKQAAHALLTLGQLLNQVAPQKSEIGAVPATHLHAAPAQLCHLDQPSDIDTDYPYRCRGNEIVQEGLEATQQCIHRHAVDNLILELDPAPRAHMLSQHSFDGVGHWLRLLQLVQYE